MGERPDFATLNGTNFRPGSVGYEMAMQLMGAQARAEKAERQVAAVETIAQRWADYAESNMRGEEGSGGPNRPRMYWDVAAEEIRAALRLEHRWLS